MEKILKNFKDKLQNDNDCLLGWHCNIAMWLNDNCDITNHEQRNNLANKFIKKFFEIDYNWKSLMNEKWN